jgi:hypothetical protein
MKKTITLIAASLLSWGLFAQVPQTMSYQCVVRNSSGVLVTNQSVSVRISILQGSANGTVVYQEIYNPRPQTNANGLINLEIGGGSVITGSFSAINWAAGPFFLKSETDPSGGTNYTISGTSQLLSVPYAMFSETAHTADYNNLTNLPDLSDYLSTETDPLFSSSAVHGITNSNITNWNAAYAWGNHAAAGYQPFIAAGTTAQYLRGDKTWQTLNKGTVGLGSVENTALSAWTGSNHITTLGTVVNGVWNAGEITSNGTISGSAIVKSGGTGSQFLKADGSVDANSYLTAIKEVTDEFIGSSDQTVFELSHTPSSDSKVKMYINGVRISNSAYSLYDSTLTYLPLNNGSYELSSGDRIEIDYFY